MGGVVGGGGFNPSGMGGAFHSNQGGAAPNLTTIQGELLECYGLMGVPAHPEGG